ncbi:MAG: E3 binding domain-containing protein, partial [Chloroflexi bacterium]|nr:E3 binding domain-containing protein [Chloroflexota bacterium]
MPFNIVVPPLGESVVEATVAHWRKHEGEAVRAGETLVELETDKVNLEVGAERDGVLARIVRAEGSDVKIGDVLGEVQESKIGATSAPTATAVKDEAPTTAPAPDVQPSAAPPGKQSDAGNLFMNVFEDKNKATPVARRIAEERGIDLARVKPSGADGRVTKEDVENFLEQGDVQPQSASAQPGSEIAARTPAHIEESADTSLAARDGREQRVRMSRRRRTIARRLVEAQHTAAMLTTFNEIDMSAVMDIRTRRRETFTKQYGV